MTHERDLPWWMRQHYEWHNTWPEWPSDHLPAAPNSRWITVEQLKDIFARQGEVMASDPDPLDNYTITMSVNAESLTALIDRLVGRRVRQEVATQLQHLIQLTMEEENERPGMGSPERRQPVAHDHVPVSQDVFEGRRGQSGENGGLRLHDGSGNVHPGSGRGEHRGLDLSPSVQKIDVKDPSEDVGLANEAGLKPLWYGTETPDHPETTVTPDADGTHDMMLKVHAPVDAWAALVLEHEFEGFSVSNRGRSANDLYTSIRRTLDEIGIDWRGAWPKKSSR